LFQLPTSTAWKLQKAEINRLLAPCIHLSGGKRETNREKYHLRLNKNFKLVKIFKNKKHVLKRYTPSVF
jgi:hypothetical protein